MVGFLQSPGACMIKAAKAGIKDNLSGSLDALAWGRMPSLGTGGQFDILYSGKVRLYVPTSYLKTKIFSP